MSIDELDAAIRRLARHMNAVNYQMLVLLRDFDDRFGWAKWSFTSCAEWLAWRCGLGLSAAREKVRVAHALRDLPEISKAFQAGRLSYSKVRALTRCADASNERKLLAYALEVSAAQVEERCRQIRNVQPESVEEARRAWSRRSMTIFRNEARGSMTISIEVPLDAGEVIAKAVDRAVECGEVATGPEFGGHGWHAQQADALVAVARAYLGTYFDDDEAEEGAVGDGAGGRACSAEREGDGAVSAGHPDEARALENSAGAQRERVGAYRGTIDLAATDPAPADAVGAERLSPEHSSARSQRQRMQKRRAVRATAADRYQIVVHVDEAALRGGAGRSEMPIETVKRLACDGSVTVVTENGRGEPLNVGRRHRIVPLGLRRALWSRDRGCTFPGCRHRRYVEAHHLHHWVHGGETSPGNTMLLCSHHHRLVHEGGLRVQREADGTFQFRRADGRAIPRCGYRTDDAEPDEGVLEGSPYPSAEGWLAALVSGRSPPAGVREEAAVYEPRSALGLPMAGAE